MKKYIGGYYLIKPREMDFGSLKDQQVLTCSSCINDPLFDSWTISWAEPIEHQVEVLRNELGISEQKQLEIQRWADQKFEEEKIGWLEVFQDLETVKYYSENFFSHIEEKEILMIVFPEDETEAFLKHFSPHKENIGASGIYQNLKLKKEFSSADESGIRLGWDLIGVEYGGSNFHTFHCHDLSSELTEKFGLKINKHGLIESIGKSKEELDNMNDE